MTTSDFARRHGYEEAARVFENPDYLPEHIRRRAGLMILEHFGELSNAQGRFVQSVEMALGPSPELWEWADTIPAPRKVLTETEDWFTGKPKVSFEYDITSVHDHLVRPLKDCEWHAFYGVVENVCAEWDRTGATRERRFAPEFNKLLASFRIPWMLKSGLVIPADEYAFAADLEYLGQTTESADVSDPRVSLKKAFVALFRKQDGPDIAGACLHAWSAWETARELSGGIERVKRAYPEVWGAITALQKLIHAGRHPGKKLGRPPTEEEARFIVGLLTNAVQLLSDPTATDEASWSRY